MKTLTLLVAHARLMLAELFRAPGYVIPTVGFPAMFFTIFAMPYARDASSADFELLSYVAFAIIGVTLFQFGVGIAAERGRPWDRYVRTLPAPPEVRFAARIIAALVFGVAAGGLVAVVARIFTPVDLNAEQWMLLALYALLGGIPFVLFGITIGYWTSARAALPIANVCYLLLSFAGGLWLPPRMLPGIAAAVSPFLPTRQFAELLWSISGGGSRNAFHALGWLGYYAAFFAVVAAIGYHRDEHRRYA